MSDVTIQDVLDKFIPYISDRALSNEQLNVMNGLIFVEKMY